MKIGMIFPGYGSQYVGMAKDVYDTSRIMQEYFDQASLCVDINFIKLCFASSDAELSKMAQAFQALFVVNCSLYATLAQEGIEPDVVAGYNVGEYVAMHASKGLSFADGLYLLKKFTLYAQELLDQNSFAMARIKGLSTVELQKSLKEFTQEKVVIAAYEMPHIHVVSGSEKAVHTLLRALKDNQDAKVEEISPAFGMHSALMAPAVEKFKIYLEKVDFKDTTVPLIANVTGRAIDKGADLKEETIAHFTEPIAWFASLQALYDCDVLLFVGPGKQLLEQAKQLYPHKQMLQVATQHEIEEAKKAIAELKEQEMQQHASENPQ
jgi:[acyl-carrier-protein] S-malonyltransferase